MSDEQLLTKNRSKTSVWRVIASTFAAFLGVQSDKNREHDFQQKSILPYMISGVLFATVFILSLVFIAQQLDPTG